MKIKKYENKYYEQVKEIYEISFPKQERYLELKDMINKDNTELVCLVENDTVLGIMYLIKYKNMIFVLYLAINPNIRSKGYGSYMLKWLLENNSNKNIFLNIEEVVEISSDYETRKRRMNFYIKNGFYITDYVSKEDKENFNILSNKNLIDVEEYKKLDLFVAQIIDEAISNIVKLGV